MKLIPACHAKKADQEKNTLKILSTSGKLLRQKENLDQMLKIFSQKKILNSLVVERHDDRHKFKKVLKIPSTNPCALHDTLL